MNISNIPISNLKPAAYNPRKISRQMLKSLKANIKEFGVIDPLIINADMTIIGGHQRFKAYIELGIKDVPCVVLDLPKTKEKALNLALNKIGGDWDRGKLDKLLKEIESIDMELTGFSEDEIKKLEEELNIEAPEYDIAPRLMEEYPYIVLFFKNTLDFQVASEHFGLKTVKEDRRNKIGLGKVIDGAEYMRGLGK